MLIWLMWDLDAQISELPKFLLPEVTQLGVTETVELPKFLSYPNLRVQFRYPNCTPPVVEGQCGRSIVTQVAH